MGEALESLYHTDSVVAYVGADGSGSEARRRAGGREGWVGLEEGAEHVEKN